MADRKPDPIGNLSDAYQAWNNDIHQAASRPTEVSPKMKGVKFEPPSEVSQTAGRPIVPPQRTVEQGLKVVERIKEVGKIFGE